MLAYILALVIGLGSIAFYMSAFFYPEVYRKGDFVWSGVGFFYALVLWFCAGQFGGAVLLGQTASVTLLGWLGWQTLKLRRLTTPEEERTPMFAISGDRASSTAQMPWQGMTNLFQPKKKAAAPVPQPVEPQVPTAPDASAEESVVQPELDVMPELEPPEAIAEEIAALEVAPVELPLEEVIEVELELAAELEPPAEKEIEAEAEFTPHAETTQSSEDWEEEVAAPESVQKAPAPPAIAPATPKSRTVGLLTSIVDRVKGLLGKSQASAPPFPPTSTPTAPPPVAPFPTTFTADADLEEDWLEDAVPPAAETPVIETPEEIAPDAIVATNADEGDDDTEDLPPAQPSAVETVTEEAIEAEVIDAAPETSEPEATEPEATESEATEPEVAATKPTEEDSVTAEVTTDGVEPEVIVAEVTDEIETSETTTTLDAIVVESDSPETQAETQAETPPETQEADHSSDSESTELESVEEDEATQTNRKKNKGFGFGP
jgi:Ycf66 protein N-terminus